MRTSCPNIEETDKLFQIYKTLPGNEDATDEDFFLFLSKNSPQRHAFLNQYCTFSYDHANNTAIPKASPK